MELVPSVSIENLLNQKRAIIEKFTAARKLMLEANEIGHHSGFVDVSLFFNDRHTHNAVGIFDENAITRFEKKVDGKA